MQEERRRDAAGASRAEGSHARRLGDLTQRGRGDLQALEHVHVQQQNGQAEMRCSLTEAPSDTEVGMKAAIVVNGVVQLSRLRAPCAVSLSNPASPRGQAAK